MPRNSSGTYSLPESPFVSATPISSVAVNSDFSDIADALTDSLSRTGDGGMQAVLPLSSSGFSYQGDSDTGMSRSGANTQVITCGAINVVEVTASGASVTGAFDADTVTQGGFAVIFAGEVRIYAGSSTPTGWLVCDGSSLLRASYPALFTAIGTQYGAADGSHFSLPDLRGRVVAGLDGTAGRLTSATMTPNGGTVGATGGAETETLTLSQLPTGITARNSTQALSVASTVSTVVKNTGAVNSQATFGGGPEGIFADVNAVSMGAITSTGTADITVTSNNTSGSAHVNVQPTIILNFIIFAGV